jgi:hypothetical protein
MIGVRKMNEKQVIKAGDRASKMFNKAWKLNKQLEDYIVQQCEFVDVDDFENKTGLDFENDWLIDAIQHGNGFTKMDLVACIDAQKEYVKRRNL